ncbi:hypothetical protein RHMOL_RhmolMtG0003800 (mitochondrion) [Rhododendron molle]|nr:hypothetical protein RHMOL_RhmolMtG0003800 [Rhododendron molle]
MVINPLSSTTLAGLKPKLLLPLIYHHLLLSRVFLLIRKLLLIYEEESRVSVSASCRNRNSKPRHPRKRKLLRSLHTRTFPPSGTTKSKAWPNLIGVSERKAKDRAPEDSSQAFGI